MRKVAQLSATSLLLMAIAACGDGSGGAGASDTTPPTVSSTVPASAASAVASTSAVSVTFSETMDCATLSASTFTLRAGMAATGAVSCSGNTATFTPSPSLVLATHYTATVTAGAKDAAGNALAADYGWSFDVRDGAWGTAALIETDDAGPAEYPQIAFDAGGNAIAVWQQSDGVVFNIWANRYTAGQGWSVPQRIETDDSASAVHPQIAIDPRGDAVAVWTQSDGARDNIWANHYTVAQGWGAASLIETDDVGGAGSPKVALDASGNAIAVWTQSDGTRYNVRANRYSAASGTWGTAQLIQTDYSQPADGPQIAVDAAGNAIVVWYQDGDGVLATRYDIWANRYDAATGTWGAASLIETDNTGGGGEGLHVAIDGSGNAIAVWNQSDGTRFNILANRYTTATGAWGTAQLIETDNAGDAGDPRVGFDAAGNAIAVWQQFDGTRWSIFANRYNAATGTWGTAQLIETDNTGPAYIPQVAVDASGNAIAVWEHYDGTRYNIVANRYTAATGAWGTAQLIETDDAGGADGPQIAIDAGGNALAVWFQHDGTRDNIWANRFD